MKHFYLTKKINEIVSTILILLGLKEESIGLSTGNAQKPLINFDSRNRFGLYSFKAALAFLFFVVAGTSTISAQTILISPTGDGGFENGSTLAANGWTAVNASTNNWYVGNVSTPSNGTQSAFISNDNGVSNAYTNTATQYSYFYRDITVPAGETKINLGFKWKNNGEAGTYDRIFVYTAATSYTPVNSGLPTGTDVTGTTNYLVLQTTYQTATYSLPASLAGTTFRLIFGWKNDASGGTNPPGTVDEISLTSSQPSSYVWNVTSGSASWATAGSWTPARNTPDSSDILNFSAGGSSTVTNIPTQNVSNVVFSNNTTANFQSAVAATLTMGGLTIPSGSSLYSNGTTAALTMAFSSGATNTIAGRLEISNTSTPANGITFANSVTTVSGTLAAGGSTAATVTGTTTTLLINGTYEHKYTTVGGTIPTATWGSSSNCNITAYTTNTSSPGGFAQNFANFSWNCPAQTGNINLSASSTTGVSGTMNITATNTGSLRLTGTGGYVFNVNNFTQTGGTFDLANGSSGASMSFNVSGTFNQSGGTFLSGGTSTCNPTLHFNGTAAQIATFTGQPTGPITYRFSNPAGVTLNTNFATFNLGNGTLGGLRISTNATSPIIFGNTITGFAYNAANSTLTYDAANLTTTVRNQEFPATSGPTNLVVNVGSSGLLVLPFSRTISNALTMTSGDIDVSSNALTIGTAAATPGTLTWTAGNIRLTTGSLTRWYGASSLPTTVGTGVGYYPIANGINNRNVSLYFSSATITTGGSITVSHNATGGISAVSPTFVDGTVTIGSRTNSYWSFSSNAIALGSVTLGIRVTGGGAFTATTAADIRFIQSAGALGTSANVGGTSPNLQAGRTGLSLINLTGSNHYIGSTAANMQSIFNSVATGDWNSASAWDTNTVPGANDVVNIMPSHTVTVNSISNNAKTLTVAGILTLSSGDLTVAATVANNGTVNANGGILTVTGTSTTGITNASTATFKVSGGTVNVGVTDNTFCNRTFSNSGILNVTSGTLNVFGNITNASSSVFNQSGGAINIDGNAAGVAANSVASGTPLLNFTQVSTNINLTGGTLTIVDPHTASTSTSAYAIYYSNATATANTASASHITRFGNGISTDAGGNTSGFYINNWFSSALLNFGSITVNGPSGTNRSVTSYYQIYEAGNFIVNNGGDSNIASLYIGGDLTVNTGGTLTSSTLLATAVLNPAITTSPVSIPQTITNNGIIRNLTTSQTANLTSLTVNNSSAAGVTLSSPLSVSGTLTMTSGLINTTSTNLLTLGTATSAGTLVGTPSATTMIVGPFARTFAASRTAAGTYDTTTLFPLGKGTAYTPVYVDPATTSAGSAIIKGEAFAANSGTPSSDVSNLSATRWEVLTTAGFANLTSANVRVSDSGIASTHALIQASTASGVYDRLLSGVSAYAAGPFLTATGVAAANLTANGYFAYGLVAPPSLPTITGFTTAYSPSAPIYICSNGGSVVTITGTNLGTVTSVLFNGSSGVNLPGTITLKTSTSLTVVAPSGVVDGIIRVTNPAGSGDSSTAFTTAEPPTVGVSSAATICSGTSTTLTATGATSYLWAPSLGLNGTTGSSVLASPTTNTTYTVTGTSTVGCIASATVAVSVSPVASAISIAKNPATICVGGTTTLTASGGSVNSSASNYNFAASSGTFTPLSGATAVTSIKADTAISTAVPIGFSFNFAGTNYTNVYADSNGILSFNASATSQTINTFTSTNNIYPLIAPLWDDNDGSQTVTPGSASYLTTGTAGNRVFTFEWLNWEWNYSANDAVISFQVKLYEADGRIEFIYRSDAAAVASPSASIGIASANGNYLSLNDSSASPTASSTVNTTAIATKPATGQVYSFTPPTQPSFVWSSSTDLFTDAAATVPYSGGSQKVVYSKSNSSQTYTATSTLGSCPVSTSVTVTPNALPTISINGNSTICAGGTGASLIATGGVSYLWSPTTGLSFADVANPTATPSATTTYTVTGTDANGCKNSATSTVTVNAPAAITTQPANQTAVENGSVSFSVVASGTSPSYQWQYSTNGGTNWSNVEGETSSTYTITSAPVSLNNNQYRVIVSGTAPCSSVTSSAVTLLVGSVAIVTQPANQTVCSNAGATFSIVTSGDVTSYQWQYSSNGTTYFDVDGENSATLVLSGITSDFTGLQYRCSLNNGALYSNPALLTVYNAISIGTQPTNQTVCSNAVSVTFTSAATGSGVSYLWQVSTNGGSSWTNISGATAATYTINTPGVGLNNNRYRVVVSGTAPCGSVASDAATLTITDVTVAASSTSICIGQPVTLNATYIGVPNTTSSSWVCATAGSGATTAVSGDSAAVTPTAAGTYVYTFTTNGSCSFTRTVSVTVNALPIISSVTATPVTICSGSTVNLAAASVVGGNGTAALGAGALTASTTSNGISPFSYNWGGTKTQYLVKASELTALGFAAGNITSLGFETTSVGQTYTGFSLSVGSTTANALTTTFLPNGTQVYLGTLTNDGYLPVANSLNTLTFGTGSGSASSFAWDGTSNLVLTFSWSSIPAASNAVATPVKYDTTSFVSATYKQADSVTPAEMLANTTGTTLSSRPKFTFGGVLATNFASTYTWSWNSSPVITTATGTTSVANTSGAPISKTFTATATSAAGCVNSLTSSAVTVNSTIPVPTAIDGTQCGIGTPTCSVTGSGRSGNTFRWYTVSTNGTAISGQTGSTLVAPYTIAATTTFYVSEFDGLCESPRVAVTQTVTAPLTFALSTSTVTNCSGSPSLTPVTIATNGGYDTFTWSNPTTVSGNSTTGWTFSPTTTTTYTLTASGGGCSTTTNVVVTPTVLPVVTVAASPSAICVGASSTLTALTNTIVAGNATIGAGATTSATYSNPFYSLWSNNHTQHLITAADLTAMGLKAGNITSVGLNVTSAGTLPMIDLSVKIGTTTATSMTAFVSNAGFQTVYTNASLLPTTGVNTLTFTTPFNWDGTSNLVLEFCHGNSSSGATMSRTVLADNTSYVSSVKAHVGAGTAAATICGDTTTNLVSYSVRPQFIFNGQVASQGAGTLAYTWNGSSTTGNVLTASPTTTTTYTVYGFNGTTGCTGTATATVTVYTLPTAPSVTNAIQCGARVPLVSVADTNGYTTPTFKWYADDTTTTALQTSTSTTFTGSINATTTFYVSVVSPGGCESPRAAVTTTVVTPATLTVTPDTTVCTAGSATLTASGAVSYTWSPALGLNGTTTASVVATPNATTTYSVTGVDANGCTTAAATVKVTVAPYPSAVTITKGATSVCTNGVMSLTASGGAISSQVTVGPATPALQGGTTGAQTVAWNVNFTVLQSTTLASIDIFPLTSGQTGSIAVRDGSGTLITSYPFTTNVSGGATAQTIVLNHALAAGTYQLYPTLPSSGITRNISGASYPYTSSVANITGNGYDPLYFMGFYNWKFGSDVTPTYVWSPTTDLYTNASGTNAYTGGSATVVYTKPSMERTYTATASNGACGTPKSITITPEALPVFTVSDAITICKGQSTTLNATGAGLTYTWSPALGLNGTTGASVTANPTVTTTYTVEAINASGCKSSQTVAVTVSEPGAILSGTTSQLSIAGGNTTFSVVTASGTTYTYQWQVNDGSGWVNLENGSHYTGVTTSTLTVNDIQDTWDGYLYQCLVIGASPCATLTPIVATLTISTTGIETQPQSVTVCAPGSTTFNIVTNGDEPFGVLWQMSTDNGVNFIDVAEGTDTVTGLTFSGVDTTTLGVSGVTFANNGIKFQCMLNYYLLSDSATLVVKQSVAASNPVSQTLCASGGTATFSTTATGSDLAYQWQFSTNGGSTWNPYTGTGATSASISIVNPALGLNGTQYRVVVSGSTACTSVTTAAATLFINNPTITSEPVATTVIRRNTASFSVVASAATSYQWQRSTTLNGTYTDVVDATPTGVSYTGATTATLSVITSGTTATGANNFYRCVVTNSGCSVNSKGGQMTVIDYCVPTYSSGAGTVDQIANVTVNELNNSSEASISPYYTFFNDVTIPNIARFSNTQVSVTFGADTTNYCAVWIDFNQNGVFEASEGVVSSSSSAGTTVLNGTSVMTIAVPIDAVLGQTRMRVRGGDDVALTTAQACGASNSSYGETEDYIVTIVPAVTCSGTPVAGTAAAVSTSLCAGGAGTTLTLTGATSGVLGASYQWYYSSNGTTFTPVSGATNTTLATGSLMSNAYYYCTVSCSESGLSANSNTVAITVANPLITGTTPAGRCGTGTVTLGAAANVGSSINWYSAITGGAALGTGASFTTPSILTTTTYYAEAFIGSVGTAARTAPASTASDWWTNYGLVFDTTSNITLSSVVVYPVNTSPAAMTIKLLNNSGTQVAGTSDVVFTPVSASGSTPQTVNLNYAIPVGTGYRLVISSGMTSSNKLVQESTGFTYPMTNGPVSITSNWSSSSASSAYYNWFYNWNITSGCSSARTAVVATVDALPTATISYAGSPYCSTATTGTVTRTGTAGGNYSSSAGLTIDPSTGTIDVAASTPGTYTVTYSMNGTTYCDAQRATTTVVINQALASGFAYDFAAYCTNQGVVTPTVSGTAGVFTASPTGLSINAVTGAITLASSAAGTYTVTNKVSVAGCANSLSTFQVTVNNVVTITSQPVSVSKLPGDNASFSVAAIGTGLTYQWEVNNGSGWTALSGETASSLNLTAVTAEMNGNQYRVVVSGAASCAPVASTAATLTVSTAAVATQPVNFTACNEGANTAIFSVTTTGTVDTYQWQVSTNGTTWTDIVNGGIYADATTATLSLSGLSLSNDQWQFRVVLNSTVYSNPATLTIKTAVAIGTQPVSTTGCSGGSASFTVAATGSGISYQWQVSTNGTTWNNVSGATLATLNLSSLTASMNGYQYKAIVSGASPCSALTSSIATLTVNTAVAITTQPANTTACNAANATFSVVATGTAPTYQWQMSTNGTTYTDMSGQTASSLTVSAVTLGMNGYKYRVVIAGAAPCSSVTSSAVTLTVSQPGVPTITASSTDFCPGSIVTLNGGNLGVIKYANNFDTLPSEFTSATVSGTTITTAVLNTTYKSEGTGSILFNTDGVSSVATYSLNTNVDLAGSSNVQLTFSHQTLMEGPTTSYDYGYVEYSSNGGSTWTTFPSTSYAGTAASAVFTSGNVRFSTRSYADWITAFTSSSSLPSNSLWKTETFNIPAAALTSQFRIRFRYTTDSSTNYYGWMIDNVKISIPNASTTWSPTTGLYTNAAATTAYTGGNATTVYAKPTGSATYTITTANSFGCSNTASVNLNLLTPSTLGSITQPLITCSGAQTTFNLTGLLPNSTSTINYTINSVAQTAITGVVANASGNASFTVALPAVNNGRTLAITSLTRTDLTPSCTTAITANNTVVIAVQSLVTYYQDADGDGFGNNAVTQITCQGQPTGYVTNNTDCDDTDNTKHATFNFYVDADGDGYGAGAPVALCAVNSTTPPTTGYVTNNTDCNDADATKHASYSFYVDADSDGYGAGSLVSVCAVNAATPPVGYSLNGTDCAPADATKWRSTTLYVDADGDGYDNGTATVCWGATVPTGYSQTTLGADCNDTNASATIPVTHTSNVTACGSYVWSVNGNTYTTSGTYTSVVNSCLTEVLHLTISCSSVVTITANIEGYYDAGTHAMRPVLMNQGVGSSSTDVDHITVELHDASTYALVATTTAMLQTNGTAVATYSTAPSGSFYVVVKHRNSLETWSAAPVAVGPTPASYNFTDAASKAYGNNMKMLETGVYGFYSGDINQDGFIEGSDFSPLNNDSNNFAEGYQTTDLNGDGFVEGSDFPILRNNSNDFVESIHP